ncbi:putative amino-acid metabolite efflux pump [compost metagenome]
MPILPFLALSWLFEGSERITESLQHFSWQGLLCVLYLSLVATWLGYGLWGRLLMRYPVAQVAPLSLLVPCVGMVAAALLLDEHPNTLQWVGSGLVLLGFVVHVLGGRMTLFKPQAEH